MCRSRPTIRRPHDSTRTRSGVAGEGQGGVGATHAHLLGDVKDLIHASGKGSDQGESDPRARAKAASSADGPGRAVLVDRTPAGNRRRSRAPSSHWAPSTTDATMWRDAAGGVVAHARASGEGYWMDLPGLATFRFDERSDRVVAAPHPGIAADAVAEPTGTPRCRWCVQARGREVLHASGVLMPRGVVVLLRSLEEREVHHRLRAPSARLPLVGRRRRRPRGLAHPRSRHCPCRSTCVCGRRPRPLFGLGDQAARLAGPEDSSEPVGRAPAPLEAVCVLHRGRGTPGAPLAPLGASAAYPALLANAYCFSLRTRRASG